LLAVLPVHIIARLTITSGFGDQQIIKNFLTASFASIGRLGQ
jgi:hypothetical protein